MVIIVCGNLTQYFINTVILAMHQKDVKIITANIFLKYIPDIS